MDFKTLQARLFADRDTALQNCLSLFPNGTAKGTEFYIGSLAGERGESCKINLITGLWSDFASGQAGGDYNSFYAAAKGMTQVEAFKALGGEFNGSGPVVPYMRSERLDPDVLEVPPDDAPRDDDCFRHPKHGLPATVHRYLTRDGRLWYVNARYEAKGDKTFSPWIWSNNGWRAAAPPKPRPLYGLERLDPLPESYCIVVEGEKAADALRSAVANRPILTWWGGAQAVGNSDWDALRDRNVLVWPDADEPGEKAGQIVCNKLTGMGCKVAYVDIEGLEKGFDAADFMAQGHTFADVVKFIGDRKKDYQPIRPPQRVEPPKAPVEINQIWQEANLTLKKSGIPYSNEANITRILQHAERNDSRIEVWWDSFLSRRQYRREDGSAAEWTESMDTRLTAWVQEHYKIPNLTFAVVQRGLLAYVDANPRNCVVEWLQSLTWDNQPRLESMLQLGFGANPSAYARAVGRCFMVGMVARAMRPGCKVDCLPVFESAQGTFKSSALRILGGEWFSEIHESILTKDFCQSLQGKWLVEISELHSFRKHEMTAIKGRISDQVDRYRASYGHYARDWPRQGVMAGTTNEAEWATDDTGARRFWPVSCGRIDLDWLRDNRDQLFAEALHRFGAGEQWHDVPKDEAEAQQRERKMDDPWLEAVREYSASRNLIRISDLMDTLQIPIERRTMVDSRRTATCLRALGFRVATIWEGKNQYRGFRRDRSDKPIVDTTEEF